MMRMMNSEEYQQLQLHCTQAGPGAVSGLDTTRDHHASTATKHLMFFNSLNVSLYGPLHPTIPPTHPATLTVKQHKHTRIKQLSRLFQRTMKTYLLDLKICFIVHGSHSPVIDI